MDRGHFDVLLIVTITSMTTSWGSTGFYDTRFAGHVAMDALVLVSWAVADPQAGECHENSSRAKWFQYSSGFVRAPCNPTDSHPLRGYPKVHSVNRTCPR
jgi:hypothetical protein